MSKRHDGKSKGGWSRPGISVMEAARRIGLDAVCKDAIRVVRSLISKGILRARKVSKYWLVDPDSVDEFLMNGG